MHIKNQGNEPEEEVIRISGTLNISPAEALLLL
jgi:hypothetical protein